MFGLMEINLRKLYGWWEGTIDNNLKKLRNELKEYFEKIDDEIFNSKWRKDKGYISKEINSRSILTIAGYITFYRRRYKYFDEQSQTWKYVYLADHKLGIERYERINSHVKFKILELIAEGMRYENIINILKINISKMSISNVINSFDLKDFDRVTNYDIKKVPIKNCLYIQLDDTFVSLRDNKKKKVKYRIRFVTMHTGYDESKSIKNRKVIANKRSLFKLLKTGTKINTANFMDEVYEFANKFYENVKDATIIISGDSASWIQECSKFWPGSLYVYDKFHAFRKLKNTLMIDKSEKSIKTLEIVKSYYNTGDYDNLLDILQSFLENPDYIHKSEKIKDTIGNFKNNKIGIINQANEFNIGCHIESDISHTIKWLLGYGSKAFNYKTFQNMLILKISKVNKINPLSLIQEEVLEMKQDWKDYYWQNLWINNKNIDNEYEYHCQGEIILQSRNPSTFIPKF